MNEWVTRFVLSHLADKSSGSEAASVEMVDEFLLVAKPEFAHNIKHRIPNFWFGQCAFGKRDI